MNTCRKQKLFRRRIFDLGQRLCLLFPEFAPAFSFTPASAAAASPLRRFPHPLDRPRESRSSISATALTLNRKTTFTAVGLSSTTRCTASLSPTHTRSAVVTSFSEQRRKSDLVLLSLRTGGGLGGNNCSCCSRRRQRQRPEIAKKEIKVETRSERPSGAAATERATKNVSKTECADLSKKPRMLS